MANYTNNKRKMSDKTKSVLVTIGMILLIFALLAGVYTLMNKKDELETFEGFEHFEVTWKQGGINAEDGSMVKDKKFMYSCEIPVESALKIRREYGSHVSFTVYYYNELGNLVYKDAEATTSHYTKSIDDIKATDGYEDVEIDHARIVIEWLQNDNDELNWFERNNLKKSINVYVTSPVEDTVEETPEDEATEE